MLREDMFDIDVPALENYVPAVGVVQPWFKAKTTKSP